MRERLETFAAQPRQYVSQRAVWHITAAALLVDPQDFEAIADCMCRLCLDEGLREEMIARGAQRVAQFSWEKAAQQTMQVYRKVCSR